MKKFFVMMAAFGLFASCQESLEQRASRALQEYTQKNCPVRLNETTVLDSCRFETATHTLHYYYTFTGAMDNAEAMEPVSMRQILADVLRNDTQTRAYKEAGYSFQYTYTSEQNPGQVLFDTVLTAEDYR